VTDGLQLFLLTLAVFLLGTPHGALDAREARDWLRPRLGNGWALRFVAGYLALAGLTLGLWLLEPVAALAAFLALAAVHFGEHDSRSGAWLPVLVRGALPPVVAAAAHPGEIAAIFALLAGGEGPVLAALLGGPLLVLWLAGAAAVLVLEPATPARAELLLLAALFALAPPLVAFACYFGLLHSPRALLASRRPGERWPALLRDALPWSLAAVCLAVPLWATFLPRLGSGDALVRTIFWWLSALTVPHMALHLMIRRRHPTAAARSWRGSPSPAGAG
jgi:Brp/Blh family beta-carotene 15,15'-monooxygenase